MILEIIVDISKESETGKLEFIYNGKKGNTLIEIDPMMSWRLIVAVDKKDSGVQIME